MKFATIIPALFITICSFLFPNSTKASHCAGGEIVYEWLADSTYRVYFKFYRDCTGVNEGTVVQLCYRNSCNSQGGNVVLAKVVGNLPDGRANGSPVYEGCPGFPNKCISSAGAIRGIREWWYTNIVTLPSRCNYWTFSASISARNVSANINGGNFFVEATLDNLTAQGNSSPFFSVKPIPYVCVNQPYTYNNGTIDPNSDSLTFEIIAPLTGGGCPASLIPVNFKSGTPSYNLINNPFQTSNTFVLSASTGQMSFTPSLVGAHTMAVRVREYRNGVQIGSTMRDIQMQALACSSPPIVMNIATSSIAVASYTNGRVEGCAGVPLSFCFDLKSSVASAVLVASDNHNFAAPGSSLTYQNQANDSIRGCFSWTAGALDTGIRILTVTAKDSSCVSPGIAISQTFLIPLYIHPSTFILKDTGICLGDSVQITAIGGTAFTWTVVPGGSLLSSLSCLNCKSPYVKPTITTKYVVTSNLGSTCPKNKDTVTIMVTNTRPTTPTVTSNAPLCVGDTLRLQSSTAPPGISYYWVGPAGFKSNLQNPVVNNVQLIDAGIYMLRMMINGCASHSDTAHVVISSQAQGPATTTVNYCIGDPTVPLTAVGYNLKWFTSSFGGTQLPSAPTPSSATPGSFVWYVSQTDHCGESVRAPAYVNVALKSLTPVGNDLTYCRGQVTFPLTATGTNLKWYTLPTGGSPLPSAPIPSSAVAGVYNWYVSQKTNCSESDRDTVTIIIDLPALPSVSNLEYCLGVPAAQLTANGTNLLWYNSPTGGVGDTSAPTPSTVVPGVYYYYVTQTVGGCESDRAIISVTVLPPTPIQLQLSSNPVCIGDSVWIENILSNPTAVSYYWSLDNGYKFDTIQNGVGVTWSTSGAKKIILELNDGLCITRDSTIVEIKVPPVASFEIAQSACVGQLISLYPSLQDAYYYWTIDGAIISDTVYNKMYQLLWDNKGDRMIQLTLVGKNECTDTFRKTVRVHENPIGKIESISKLNACKGDTILFQATTNPYYSYEWSPQGIFLNANAPNVVAVIGGSAPIKLIINNEWGCSITDEAYVSTEHCCDIIFPDAFTPNGDGHNDKFRNVASSKQYTIHTFIVVNRWGKVLFETQDIAAGWDGTYNNEVQGMGTYYYYIKYICDSEPLDKKGNFILLR